MRLLAADGSEFRVPRDIGALLAELIEKVRSLEELVLDQQRHAASSTHIAEGRTGQNVRVRERVRRLYMAGDASVFASNLHFSPTENYLINHFALYARRTPSRIRVELASPTYLRLGII